MIDIAWATLVHRFLPLFTGVQKEGDNLAVRIANKFLLLGESDYQVAGMLQIINENNVAKYFQGTSLTQCGECENK